MSDNNNGQRRYTVTIGRPDWQVWRQIKKAELWEAVALSLNLNPEPDLINLKTGNWPPGHPVYWHAKHFRDLLLIAERSLGRGLKQLSDGFFSLPDFAAWAEGLGRTLPDEFPRQPDRDTEADSSDTALEELLIKIECRARDKDLPFDRDAMPGTRADLHEVAQKIDNKTFVRALVTFQDYLKGRVKFKRGAKPSPFYRNLFPEYTYDEPRQKLK